MTKQGRLLRLIRVFQAFGSAPMIILDQVEMIPYDFFDKCEELLEEFATDLKDYNHPTDEVLTMRVTELSERILELLEET